MLILLRVSTLFCLCLLLVCGGLAQTTDDSLTFEVASVKPHIASPGERSGSLMTGGPGTDDPGRITITNRPLRSLIIEAYTIRNFQIEHPLWVGEARYDIAAKVPPGATKQQAKIMMRNLLAERFQLQIRRETRNLSVYDLVIAKGGAKMKPSSGDSGEPAGTWDRSKIGSDGFPQAPPNTPGIFTTYMEGRAKATGQKQSLSKMVTMLTGLMDRPVIDATGLKGDYDFTLLWSLDYGPDGDISENIGAALQQQLGLRLAPRKMPIDMLIVVSALKVPKEN